MSVEFRVCSICNSAIYEDNIDYCSCGERICFWCQATYNMRSSPPDRDFYHKGWREDSKLKPYWNPEEHDELECCPLCRKEVITDEMIVSYLLSKYNLDKSKVIEEIKKSNG